MGGFSGWQYLFLVVVFTALPCVTLPGPHGIPGGPRAGEDSGTQTVSRALTLQPHGRQPQQVCQLWSLKRGQALGFAAKASGCGEYSEGQGQ